MQSMLVEWLPIWYQYQQFYSHLEGKENKNAYQHCVARYLKLRRWLLWMHRSNFSFLNEVGSKFSWNPIFPGKGGIFLDAIFWNILFLSLSHPHPLSSHATKNGLGRDQNHFALPLQNKQKSFLLPIEILLMNCSADERTIRLLRHSTEGLKVDGNVEKVLMNLLLIGKLGLSAVQSYTRTLCYFVHRHLNNARHNNAHSCLTIIARNGIQDFP